MRINDFFLEAMQNNAWHNPKWVKSIFCLRREDPLAWHNDKYPYRIVTANDGYYYLNKELVLTRLEGAEDITRAPVPFREPITVPPNTIPNWASGGETDIGILFANYVLLIGVFHDKIPYINGEVKINKIEKIIVDNREDYPNGDPNNPDRKKDKFYIDEFIKFSRACDYLENFNDLFVPGGSPKMMTLHPDYFAYRDSLVKEYEGKLNNPIYAAEFVNKLLDTPHAKHVCIENPVSVISTRLRKPDQIIQPYQFGHPEKKKTCLWLKNLPKLESTEDVSHILESLPKRERERVLFMPQSKNRAKLRSVFYTGIAEAMAKQWGSYIRKQHNNESI